MATYHGGYRGNPPFLGDKKMIGELGEDYVLQLRSCYKGKMPMEGQILSATGSQNVEDLMKKKIDGGGLVSTQSISASHKSNRN